MSVNKVILVGNLGADPDGRETRGSGWVANLRLATTSRVKKGDEWVDDTEWHRVVCYGNTAENVLEYCKKGKQLYVEGRIRTDKWEDKEGNTKFTTEIVAQIVRFLGGRS